MNNQRVSAERMDEMRYEIQNQHGEVISRHRTYEAAQRKHQRDLAWRCGICGNSKGGWGRCNCGTQNRVCSAEHYNDKIIQVS